MIRMRIMGTLGFLVVFILSAASAYAADPSSARSLGELISNLYDYSLSIVGLCVFVMFLYAGMQIMINGDRAKAIRIAQDAVIGTILLFSAVTILNSINQDLVCQREGKQACQ